MMYNISFPHLNLYFQLSPIAFRLGSITVYWYGIILAVSFLLGFFYINHRAHEYNLNSDETSTIITFSSVCAIICARIYYVIFYPGDFYKNHPEKIFMISEGGIAIYGAIIGGAVAVLIMAKILKKNAFQVLDVMSLGLVVGQCIGRWGNFVNQEAFGTETNLPWAMASENTLFKTVHPCFLYESLGCLLIFLILHFYSQKKRKSGNIFLIYTMLYAALRIAIESLRTDSLILPRTFIKISQLVAILLFIFSATIFLYKKSSSSK